MKETDGGTGERPRHGRILLVDDDRSQLVTLRAILEEEGFEVESCGDPGRALARIETGQFGVIVVDLRMPGLSGTDLLEHVRRMNVRSRVIINTGYGSFESAKRSLNLGAFAYVEKLSDPVELIQHVHRAQREQLVEYTAELEEAIARRTAALEESERRFRNLFERSQEAILFLSPVGVVHMSNFAASELFGLSSEELVGRDVRSLFSPLEDAERFHEALVGSRALRDIEAHFRRADGEDRACLVSAIARDEHGVLVEFQVSLHDITERKQLEQMILNISEHEQERIGRDLHDDLGQHLTGLSYLLSAHARKLTGQAPELADEARHLEGLIGQAIGKAKALSRGLCPVELKTGGLVQALEELTEIAAQVVSAACEFSCFEAISGLGFEREVHLFRIAQEAVNNALKHSGATRIVVELVLEDDTEALTLAVRDNGRGIPSEAERGPGMGLRIMGYRSSVIDASLRIGPYAGGGTELLCTMPLEKIPERES